MTVRVGLRIPWIFFENTGLSPFLNEEKGVQFDEEEERLKLTEATSMKQEIYERRRVKSASKKKDGGWAAR